MASSDDIAIVAFGIAVLSLGILAGWVLASFYYKPAQMNAESLMEVETDERGTIKQVVTSR